VATLPFTHVEGGDAVRLVRTHRGLGGLTAGSTAGRRRALWAQMAGPAAAAVALAAPLLVTPPAGALSDGAQVAAVRPISAISVDKVSATRSTATHGREASPGVTRLNATTGAGTSARQAGRMYSSASGGFWGPANEFPGWSGGQAYGVSCPDATDCTAVGWDGTGLVHVTKTDGIWSPAIAADEDYQDILLGVSCVDATDCTSVGLSGFGDEEEAIDFDETAGSWGTPAVILDGGSFNGVSCTSATDCTAVGQDLNQEPFYATETGGTWGRATEVPIPSSLGGGGDFTGVSCTSATDCTAVGSDENDQPIYATETGGTWGPATEVPVSSSLGASGYFNGVSCTSATDCTAVGQDKNDQPIYATETGGTWGTPTEVPIPSSLGASGVFTGVSCTSATDCTAVGNISGGAPIYATESAGRASQTTITSTTASPVTGQPVSIGVRVAGTSPGAGVPAPSGDVVVTDGTHSCQAALSGSNGVSTGSCSLTEDSAGTYSITAGYPGDANFGSSQTSSATTVTVGPAPSKTTITSTTASPVTGQPVTIAVQVAGKYPGTGVAAPSGAVTVTDGTRTCQASLTGSNGTATGSCQITEDAAGSYSLTASYPGDANFATSTTAQATTLTVGPAPSKTTITSTTARPVAGQPIIIEVRTAGKYTGTGISAPSGRVTVTGGTNSCQAALSGSGGVSTGSCQLTEASSGSHSLTASYPGDANFGSSTSPAVAVTVAKATTKTSLTLSASTVTYGNDKTLKLTATVTPQFTGTPTGTVTITAGTTTLCVVKLSARTGSCTPASATSLGAGSHTLTASYSGDGNFDSSAAAKTVKITKATTKTSLTLSAATVTYGKERTLVMTVKVAPQYSGTPGAQVIIAAGPTTLCIVTLSAGAGKCSPPTQTSLSPGKHTVVAAYQGNADFNTSSASKSLTVKKA
jgi:hypothetical protein